MTTALLSRVNELERTAAGILAPTDLGALWTPQSDPQRMALTSEADEVYYGGAAGGGKTDLVIGAAITQHRRSVIFRREYAQHGAIDDRVTEVLSRSRTGSATTARSGAGGCRAADSWSWARPSTWCHFGALRDRWRQ